MTLRNSTFTFLVLLFLSACITSNMSDNYIGNWQEAEFDFTESVSHQEDNDLLGIICSYKWGGTMKFHEQHIDFLWLRNEENLWTFFNVIKKIGLENFMSEENFNKPLFEDDSWNFDWKSKSLNHIVDSLIYCYPSPPKNRKYYTEFWERRHMEKNATSTFKILTELQQFYNSKSQIIIDENSINDTLYNLIRLNTNLNLSDPSEINTNVLTYFEYLRNLGLENSAANLIRETTYSDQHNLSVDSLLRTLSYDTISSEHYWDTRNNATWIQSYADNGP